MTEDEWSERHMARLTTIRRREHDQRADEAGSMGGLYSMMMTPTGLTGSGLP